MSGKGIVCPNVGVDFLSVTKRVRASAWLVGGFLACFVAGFMLGGAGTSVITSGDSIRSTPAVTLAPLDRSFPLTVRPPPTRDPAVKTVVITTAVSYSFHEWQRFVVPLRRVYDGDVFVLVVESERRVWQDLVAKHRLQTVLLELSEKPPKQGEESSAAGKALELARANAVKKARYAQYNRICAKYDWCFATDFRDVFFQADPFGRLPAGHDLALTQEWAGYPIGKCHVNSEWLLSCWPQAFYDSVKSRPILCSGTILGTPRGFAQLFEAMLAAYAGTAGKRGCFARDQGHLMYVAYSGELERRLPGRVLLQVRLVSVVAVLFLFFLFFFLSFLFCSLAQLVSVRSRGAGWPCRWRC